MVAAVCSSPHNASVAGRRMRKIPVALIKYIKPALADASARHRVGPESAMLSQTSGMLWMLRGYKNSSQAISRARAPQRGGEEEEEGGGEGEGHSAGSIVQPVTSRASGSHTRLASSVPRQTRMRYQSPIRQPTLSLSQPFLGHLTRPVGDRAHPFFAGSPNGNPRRKYRGQWAWP